nr:hypothetical protein [uncultured Methanoregula sp.]
MDISEAIITVVLFFVITAIAWIGGSYLYPIIGTWGTYIAVYFFLVALICILETRGLADISILPGIALTIAIASMINFILQPYIGGWSVFVAFIVFLLEIALIAKERHWSI